MSFSAILNIIIGALEQGLIYGILALGLLITYRILDFPDLTVDSSFPLGAAITAVLTMKGVPVVVTLLAAVGAGALAGLVTGFIHVRCHVRDLLSGIITMTGLYSINLRIAGTPNLPFFSKDTLFRNSFTKSLPAWIAPYSKLLIALLIVVIVKLLLDWYLRTKAGLLLRSAGDNASVVTTLAKDVGSVKIVGLMIANALVALSGAVMAQSDRRFEISMGTGTMVTGLASVIIGTNIFRRVGWMKSTTMAIIGSVFYKGCVSLAISCGIDAQDMKLVTAVLFLLILVLGQVHIKRKKVRIHA